MPGTSNNACLESPQNTKRPLSASMHSKSRTCYLPDATTVLAHSVFSMLRLS